MKEVTNYTIEEYGVKQLGIDFMGYKLQKGDIYTFHHLIIPNRQGGPYAVWNGAILCGKSSHPCLHLIEAKDYDMFCAISSEMIDMNIKGHIDLENIRYIDDCLTSFEREHCSDRSRKGKILLKEEYTNRPRYI